MSQDELHEVAQADTPSRIVVPNSIIGLVVWAAGRWGVMIIFSAALAYAVIRVYEDYGSANKEIVEYTRAQTAAARETADAMRELNRSLSLISDRLERVERRLELQR